MFNAVFGDDGLDLFGTGAAKKAERKNEANVRRALNEIGTLKEFEEGTLFAALRDIFNEAEQTARGFGQTAQQQLIAGAAAGRASRQSSFRRGMSALERRYAEAQEQLGAGVGQAIEGSVQAQTKAMAQIQQGAIGSGLSGAAARAQAAQLAAQSSQAMSGAIVQQSQMRGQLAAQQGGIEAQMTDQFGQEMMQAKIQEGMQRAALTQQLASQMTQLQMARADQYRLAQDMRKQIRMDLQYTTGPSPLMQIAAAAGGVGSMMGGM